MPEPFGRNRFPFGQLCVPARDEAEHGALGSALSCEDIDAIGGSLARQHVRAEHSDNTGDNPRPILTRSRHLVWKHAGIFGFALGTNLAVRRHRVFGRHEDNIVRDPLLRSRHRHIAQVVPTIVTGVNLAGFGRHFGLAVICRLVIGRGSLTFGARWLPSGRVARSFGVIFSKTGTKTNLIKAIIACSCTIAIVRRTAALSRRFWMASHWASKAATWARTAPAFTVAILRPPPP